MVVLDTNVIIDHLRQQVGHSVLMKLAQKIPKDSLAVSIITIQELYEGKSTAEKNKEEYLISTIAPLKILPYNYEIAQLAGEIARDLKEPIEFADAAIAATVIFNNLVLFTLNKKHFQGIKNLELWRG